MAKGSGQHGKAPWGVRLGLSLALALAAQLSPASALAQGAPVQTASMPTATVPGQGGIIAARLGVHPDKTRFVLELGGVVAFQAFMDGPRAIIDLPELAWSAPALPSATGLVRAVRVQRSGGRLRVVLDVDGPARIALAELIPPRDGRPPRLILDLVPATAVTAGRATPPAAEAAAAARPGLAVAVRMPAAPPQSRPAPIQVALPAPTPKPDVPPSTGVQPRQVSLAGVGSVRLPARKPAPRVLPMIVLDAGHGGQDPGATAVNGMFEKDIALSVAREVRRQLVATGRFRVGMTRDTDIFIRLRDRVQIARDKGADLFISLHADSIGRPEVRGLSVYTLSDKASDREAEMLAQRENRSDAIVGMDMSGLNQEVASILIDLARRDTANQSRRFAHLIVDRADPKVEILPRPIRSAGFAVLTAPDVPSVLVELGYLSHPKDAKLLVSAVHQKRLASGIVRAIEAYFQSGPVLSRS